VASRWKMVVPAQASKVANDHCVYVILVDGVARYAGQTGCLYSRLFGHAKNLGIDFRSDGVVVKYSFNRKYGEHAMREIRLIAKLDPSLNKSHRLSPYQLDNKPWAEAA
jgi:hypothetical protein